MTKNQKTELLLVEDRLLLKNRKARWKQKQTSISGKHLRLLLTDIYFIDYSHIEIMLIHLYFNII